MLRKRPFRLAASTPGISGPTLSLLLQAGQVMHELLDGRSRFRRQTRGRGILHRSAGGEQLVGAAQQRASVSEERGRHSCAAVTGRVERHQPDSDPIPANYS
jgi:hypothetical protein